MSKSDNSLVIQRDIRGHIFMIIDVNNYLVIGGEHIADINHIKMLLLGRFEMKDMKELDYFLGIEVIKLPTAL